MILSGGDCCNINPLFSNSKIMLSLPPKVSGVVNGHLVMKVDEVIWAQNPIDDVLAVVMWWGCETSTTFRPVNIARYATTEDTTEVVYEIRTSLPLFEKYLRKCGTLRIVVTDAKGVPIGIVRIPEVYNVIHVSTYENYFPIVTSSETRIGDLHVVFELIKLKQPVPTSINGKKSSCLNKKGNDSVIIDDTLSNPQFSFCETKLQNAKKNLNQKEQGIPQSRVISSRNKSGEMDARSNSRGPSRDTRRTSTCKRDIYRTTASESDPEKSEDKTEIQCKSIKKLSCDDLDDIFSQILKQGQKLQKAITLSVIEDDVSGTAHSDPLALMNCQHDSAVASQEDNSKMCCGELCGMENSKLSDKVDSSKEKQISQQDKNKVISYLQGKTMSPKEENEALGILCEISPSEEFLHELKNYCINPTHKKSTVFPKISSSMDEITQVGLETQKNALKENVKPTGVLSLSGLTFFVDYKWPSSNTSNRPWAEKVTRFCSKRQVNDEILFNDYAIHNVVALNEQDAINVLVTLLGKVVFRVCARQINQRDTIILGEASLTSIFDLFNSPSLSREFLAPVIASDGIFVAALNVQVELGKDKIHFGGPSQLSGQNIVRKISDDSGDPTPFETTSCKTSADKADTDSSTTILKPCSVEQPCCPDEPQTCTQPPRPRKAPKEGLRKTQPYFPNAGLNTAKMETNLTGTKKLCFVNHDLAITVQRISDCHAVAGLSPQNVHFIVAYRFPDWDATKLTTIKWNDFSTDPAMCKEDLHFFGANRVHSSLLPGSETFHSFLRDAVQAGPNNGIEFILFYRTYYPKINDTPTGVARLPLDTISTLEEAFADATTNNAHFTESSCASVIMDLPLQRIRNNVVLDNESAIGILHLKLDYRNAYVQPIQREGSGDSQLDAFAEEKNMHLDKKEEAPAHLLKHPWSLPPNIQTVNAVRLPNIAVAIHNIGKIAEKYPMSAWLNKDSLNDRHGNDVPSRRIETVFITDPSDSFGPYVVPQYNTLEEQSKLSQSELNKEKENKAIFVENGDALSKKRLVHVGTKTEESTSSFLPECRTVGLQTAESDDLTVEVYDAEAPSLVVPRQPVKSSDVSTSTEAPLQSDQELQTNLPGQTTGCQTSETLMNLAKEEMSESGGRRSAANSHRLSRQSSVEDCNSEIEAVAVKSSAESETIPQSKDGSDEPFSHTSGVGVRNSIKTGDISGCDTKASSKGPSIDCSMRESPGISECERNLLSKKQTTEVTKRRGATSVIHSRTSNVESLSDRGVAGGDKSPVMSMQPNVNAILGEMTPAIPARIELECAFHLPECEFSQEGSVTFATVQSDKAESGQEILNSIEQLITPSVPSHRDVYWNWSCQVELPTSLLTGERRLLCKVWQQKGKVNAPELLGVAAVDLTVLAAGLPIIDGWFNILDISGKSQGQIKVVVAPQRVTALDLAFPTQISSSRKTSRSFDPGSYYLAQGMFKTFPTHLTNHDDILVQKVKNVSEFCSGSGRESLKSFDSTLTDAIHYISKDNVTEEASSPFEVIRQKKFALLKYLEEANKILVTNNEDIGITPTSSLREILAELEQLTARMKERIHTADLSDPCINFKRNWRDIIVSGAIPKQKSLLQAKSGKDVERPTKAQELVHAWSYDSPRNPSCSDSPRRSVPSVDGNLSEPRSRAYGKFAQFSRCADPLWEQDDYEDDDAPVAERETEVISEWIADAAIKEMVNMAQLFFHDIMVVPQVGLRNSRNDVQMIELDEENEDMFPDIEEARAGSADNPNKSEDITSSLTANDERLRSPGNEVDSGVDVDQSSLRSRRNRIFSQQKRIDRQWSVDHPITHFEQNSEQEVICNDDQEQRNFERSSVGASFSSQQNKDEDVPPEAEVANPRSCV